MRWSIHSGGGSILLLEDHFHGVRGNFSGADLDERADDATAHFIKKSFAFNDEGEAGTAAFDLAAGERSNSIFENIAAIGGEGSEVVTADESTGGDAHFCQIQLGGHVP